MKEGERNNRIIIKHTTAHEVSYEGTTLIVFWLTFHLPRRWFALNINKSLSICNESVTTFNLLPGTSCHSIDTSSTGMFSILARSRISTSKIQVVKCWLGKIRCAAFLVKSLNPHWVSRI